MVCAALPASAAVSCNRAAQRCRVCCGSWGATGMTLLVHEGALQARWAATRVMFLLHDQLCVSSELSSVLSSGHKHMSMHHVGTCLAMSTPHLTDPRHDVDVLGVRWGSHAHEPHPAPPVPHPPRLTVCVCTRPGLHTRGAGAPADDHPMCRTSPESSACEARTRCERAGERD